MTQSGGEDTADNILNIDMKGTTIRKKSKLIFDHYMSLLNLYIHVFQFVILLLEKLYYTVVTVDAAFETLGFSFVF